MQTNITNAITTLAYLSGSILTMADYYTASAWKNEITIQGAYSSSAVKRLKVQCDKEIEITDVDDYVSPQGFIKVHFRYNGLLVTVTFT